MPTAPEPIRGERGGRAPSRDGHPPRRGKQATERGPARQEPAHRRTHRDTILDVLAEEARSLSAREVYLAMVRGRGVPVGLTTVYRVLHRLVDEHRATTMPADDGTTLYRIRRPGALDRYLLCRRCGRAHPFSAPEVEEFCDRFARAHGFTDVRHHIRLQGICPRCRTAGSAERDPAGP